MEDFYLDLVIDILFGPDLGAGRLWLLRSSNLFVVI